MDKNTAVVSLDLARCAQATGTRLFQLSGNNTGNLLFTEAVYSQLDRAERIRGQEQPEALEKYFDRICIPAANWIYPKFEFDWLADILEKSKLPVCCVGLGAQIDADELGNLTAGTLRFLHVLSDQSVSIGVRGTHTANLLERLGIKNVEVLGCPSLFQAFEVPVVRLPEKSTQWTIGGSFTRFSLSPGRENISQRQLAKFLFQFADRIYFQSEIEEIQFLAQESEVSRGLADFYSQPKKSVVSTLKQKGKCFNNLGSWLDDLRECSMFYSSRIHGCVAAILAGRPAILLTHDHRTRELAESMAIANFPIEKVRFDDLKDQDWVYRMVEVYTETTQIWSLNRSRLLDFYKRNQVPVHEPVS